MINLLLSVIAVLLLVIGVLYAGYKIVDKDLDNEREKTKKYEEVISSLQSENEKKNEESKIKNDNRRKTDEKIDELHSGNTLLNAIDGLCKPKSNNS